MQTVKGINRRPRRRDRALVLRDAALKVVRRIGVWEAIGLGAGEIKLLSARQGNLHIAYRTPFQRFPKASDLLKYHAAQLGRRVPHNLPYGIDVWAPNKLFNVEWDDKGNVKLVTLRRGAWEAELITLAKLEVPFDGRDRLAQMRLPTATRH
jgi:hypothetical protein